MMFIIIILITHTLAANIGTLQKLIPSLIPSSSGWKFGSSVDIDDHFCIVGSYDEDSAVKGLAFIYQLNTLTNTWTEKQILSASNGIDGNNFGIAVAIDGEYAIIGSFVETAYIFKKDSSDDQWKEVTKLTASDAAFNDAFSSHSVGISDAGYAIVGASHKDADTYNNQGAAYMFKKNDIGGWNEETILTPSAWNTEISLYFGRDVAISGTTVIVGAYGADRSGAYSNNGVAFIYELQGVVWEEKAILAPTVSNGACFGKAVDISDGFAIIAAYGDGGKGSAFIYEKQPNGEWIEKQKLIASDASDGDEFGQSVAINSNGYCIICAARLSSGTGACYIFYRDATGTWLEKKKIMATDPKTYSYFGLAVSISDQQRIIIGEGGYGSAYGSISEVTPSATDNTASPTDNTPAPTDSTPAPTDSTPAPTDSTPAPTNNTPSPTDNTPAPTDSTPAPTDNTPAPTNSTPAPTDNTPAPTNNTPAPTDNTPAPTDSTPAPTDNTPSPTNNTPSPTDNTPAPTDNTPSPTDSTPAPTDSRSYVVSPIGWYFWMDAKEYCAGIGTTLASIITAQDEYNAINTMKEAGALIVWIGLNDRESEGEFVWDDGTECDVSGPQCSSLWHEGLMPDNFDDLHGIERYHTDYLYYIGVKYYDEANADCGAFTIAEDLYDLQPFGGKALVELNCNIVENHAILCNKPNGGQPAKMEEIYYDNKEFGIGDISISHSNHFKIILINIMVSIILTICLLSTFYFWFLKVSKNNNIHNNNNIKYHV